MVRAITRQFGRPETSRIIPIANAQVLAQTDHAHLGYVKDRRDEIWLHFKQYEQRASSIFTASFWQLLEARKKRQLSDFHILAHWLLPEIVIKSRFRPGKLLPFALLKLAVLQVNKIVLTTLKDHIHPSDLPHVMQAFLRYYTRRGPFRDDHSSWRYAEDLYYSGSYILITTTPCRS